MKQRLLLLLVVCFGIACKKPAVEEDKSTYVPISVGSFSDNWTCSINPGQGANFNVAEFRLWVPDTADVSKLRAILVLLDGVNSDALPLASSKYWQAYATANNVALMGVHLANIPLPTSNPYIDARLGSGDALVLALKAIAEKNNISQIASLPFLLRGYSSGGMFSYYFSLYNPQRTVAFTDIRGWYIGKTSSENAVVPALFLIGEKDTVTTVPPDNVQQIVYEKRSHNGLWGYAIEPFASHYSNTGKSDSLTQLFFTSCLNRRTSSGSTTLTILPEIEGWLGNNSSKTYSTYDAYSGNKITASWLIDEPFAKAWVEYQKK